MRFVVADAPPNDGPRSEAARLAPRGPVRHGGHAVESQGVRRHEVHIDQLLRDPIWQAIGAIVAIAALMATVVLGLRTERRRRLAYGYTTVPLVSVNAEMRERVSILFGGRVVENVHLQTLTIVNIGGLPITSTDFERDIVVRFSDGARALSVDIVHLHPPDLQVVLERIEDSEGYINQINVRPLLLNVAEGFRVKLLVDGPQPRVLVSARVVGVSELAWFDGDTEPVRVKLLRSAFAASSLLVLAAFFIWGTLAGVGEWLVGVPAFVGGMLILLVSFVSFFVLGHRLTRPLDPYKHLR
jgi:hypothetical protein